MTREEAHKLIFNKNTNWEGKEVHNFLDAMEALGLIKFDKSEIVVAILNQDNLFGDYGPIEIKKCQEGLMIRVGIEIVYRSWLAPLGHKP